MAFTDVHDPTLDLSASPLRDSSIESVEWYENQPLNPDARKNVEIFINNMDQYTLPSEAYLQVSGRLTKIDQTEYDARDDIALVNNGIVSLFQSLVYRINGQVVEAIYTNADIATGILGLVSYSDDYAKSVGTNLFWAKDTSTYTVRIPYLGEFVQKTNRNGDQALGAVRAQTGRNIKYNKGFDRRHQMLFSNNAGGHFDVCIPLSHLFGFCRDVRKVLYGVKHSFYLQRRDNDDEAIIRAPGVAPGKVTLTKLSVWMPTVVPSLEWKLKLENWMASKAALTAYYQQTQVDQLPDQQENVTSIRWKLAITGGVERPRHIFVAFQLLNKRGNQEANPMIFDHLNITNIHVLLNNERTPMSDLSLDFQQRKYSRAYKMMVDFMGRDQDVDSGLQIDTNSFGTLYPIFHFDVEKQVEKLKDSVTDVYVECRMSEPTKGPYRAYAVVLSDKILKIQSDGNKMNTIIG